MTEREKTIEALRARALAMYDHGECVLIAPPRLVDYCIDNGIPHFVEQRIPKITVFG